MIRAVLLCLFTACLAAQQASVEGTAVNALTGEPLSGVHVRLAAITFNSVNAAYGAISDRAGHFSIASIRPGTYLLFPERSGFLYIHPKDVGMVPNLSLKPGQQLKDYRLEMTPRAILSGRVVDENGDPVQGVGVRATVAPPADEPIVLMPSSNFGTDDHGEFRLAVAPGKYHLVAQPQFYLSSNELPERRNDGSQLGAYTSTFYPAATAKDRTTIVEAVGGKETGGLEIRLARQQGSGSGATITGIVSGIPDETARAIVMLQTGDSPARLYNNRTVSADTTGKFSIPGQKPGFYRVTAFYQSGKVQLMSRPVDLSILAADPPAVTLTLGPAGDLAGAVMVEGDPPGTPAEKWTVTLDGPGAYGPMRMTGGEVDAERNFRIEGVAPGKYRFSVTPLPENAYIKKVEVDGTASPDGTVDLTSGARGTRVKVTVSRNGAQISGHVLDSDGQRLLSPLAMAILMKDENELPAGDAEMRVKPDATYSLKGIRPGKYRIFVVDAFQIGNRGEEALKALFKRGEEIEIKEGDRIAKDLKVIAREDANAKPKQ